VFDFDDGSTCVSEGNVVLEEGPGYATLCGQVTEEGTQGLLGVNVDIYDTEGVLQYSAVTDEAGHYCVDDVLNGNYSVTVVTPLGYQADEETKETSINNIPVMIDFALVQLEIEPSQRSRAYWAHQLSRALKNEPRHYDTNNFLRFAGLINVHFNQNEINPVDFYSVADPADTLSTLKKLLCMKKTGESEPFLRRLAKAQLMALMLNVVSGKVHQVYEVSNDGRTVSQAITYCDMLINDEIDPPDDGPGHGSPWCRYIRASFILGFCNLGITVPAGMIPENVIEIAYSIHTEDNLPKGYELDQNYPNPFNATTEIGFTLGEASNVKLEVYNSIGQRVVTLVDGYLESGDHRFMWDAGEAASGVYFYHFKVGEYDVARKMVLLK